MVRAANRGGAESQPQIHDAIHGLIDLSDVAVLESPVIARLILTRPLRRLRRVKQLGFASQSYVAADHSRYAHAIGTMQVMRKLLTRLRTGRPGLFDDLIEQYRACYGIGEPMDADLLCEHIVVAAMLQDLGELPYQSATKNFFRPDDDLLVWVGSKIDQDVSRWSAKPVFTLACLFERELEEILGGLNIQFIAFLITADNWSGPEWSSLFLPVRHMLDGEVDADRIDYVHRDAHHTVGMLGTSDDVISAILTYDDLGPVCSDPAPLGNFLATRAHLYSIVYYAPQNRFRVLLLRSIIQGVRLVPEIAATAPALGTQEIGIEPFLELDDFRLEAEIDSLNTGREKARLDKRTSAALAQFTSTSDNYSHFWLRESPDEPEAGAALLVPKDVFYEVFDAPDTVDSGIRFEVATPTGELAVASIHDVNGPYFEVVNHPRAMLPILGDVLVFHPRQSRGRDWSNLTAAFDKGTLRAALIAASRDQWQGLPADTRQRSGFTGPAIFVSYCVDDLGDVGRVIHELHRRRRRYYAIVRPNQGLGGTTRSNSVEGVLRTDAALVVASRAYQNRCATQLNGNIMHEIKAMHDRLLSDAGAYPIATISIDPVSEIHNIPWSLLGMEGPPFTGTPLRAASDAQLRDVVEAAVARIDEMGRSG